LENWQLPAIVQSLEQDLDGHPNPDVFWDDIDDVGKKPRPFLELHDRNHVRNLLLPSPPQRLSDDRECVHLTATAGFDPFVVGGKTFCADRAWRVAQRATGAAALQ
jgi:hypothetical protein